MYNESEQTPIDVLTNYNLSYAIAVGQIITN